MLRTTLAIITAFLSWFILWIGTEALLSKIWPAWFGAHQAAFTAAIKTGGAFTADTTILLIQIVLGTVVSLVAGFLAALIARKNKRAPLVLGVLLLAVGVLKAVMSWPFVPVWYHVIFTALLLPMAVVGGRLKSAGPR